MGIERYNEKRRFDRTPEPPGQSRRSSGPLRFVIQKHQASHLHYDFRLEVDGVLKSWAVPKGPSLNPADKRLAMMVEDHPLEYRTFEGIIPSGNYGAGTVMVWDQGTYHAIDTEERTASERRIREGLERGHIRFVLEGKKVNGAYSLVRLRRGEKNAWLLVKAADAFATSVDVTERDRSVLSRRTLRGIARDPQRSWGSGRKPVAASEPAPRRGKEARMPVNVKPMLATLVDEPFDRAGWIFEPKWDGYRAIAEVRRDGVRLYSRNQKSFEQKFAPIVHTLESFGHEAVLDGEVVVVDEEGRARFQLLQNYQKTGRGQLVYYAFDLLYLDGEDLRSLPLVERKKRLAGVLGEAANVRLSEHVVRRGKAFFRAAAEHGLEGMIAKNGQSLYAEGVRGPSWLKVKTHLRQEAVIAGFTEPRNTRKDLGALILGVYEGQELVYIGHTGGGFSANALHDARRKLEPYVRPTSPFRNPPKPNAAVHWVEPELVCEVSFQEWTDSGTMRQPIFVGFREDKPAHEVRREIPAGTGEVRSPRGSASGGHRPIVSKKSRRPSPELSEERAAETHREKIFWPAEGYTKGDLIDYYREVASIILPYLRDRPESLHRHPNGIEGGGFFQKDMRKQSPPEFVETVEIRSTTDSDVTRYLVCQNEATLLYLANLGCIELNPWNSRVGSLDRPDYMIVDLDPDEVSFARVVEAAQVVHRLLDACGAESVCKTSGKTGLHIFVPLGASYSYEHAKQFGEIVANLVQPRLPETTSVVRNPALRRGRIYLDFLQNRRGQTIAAPYSVRPVPGATVSTPLKWSEVRRGLDPTKYSIKTIMRRLERVGDLWKPVVGPGIDLAACVERLERHATTGKRSARRTHRAEV